MLRENAQGEYSPVLATEWKIADDKSSVTFKLRKGVKFHDGSDLTAEVVAWNYRQRIEARVRGTDKWSSVDVVDDYTVRINLKSYDNEIISGFSGYSGIVISKASYEKKGKEWAIWNPVGTGPFVFERFQRDVITKFKRNPHYWNKGLPYLDGVELHYIKDSMTQQASLQSGEFDTLGLDTGKMAADFRDKGYKIASGDTGAVVMIPDSGNPDSPFSKKKVREAVDYAIDREAIAKARGFGFWKPAYQLIPEFCNAHNPNIAGRRYDPERARKLLKEAGYPKGFKTRIIPMAFGTDKDSIVAIQAMLGAVGIVAAIENVPYSKYADYRFKGWNNGILIQPFGIGSNANRTFGTYFTVNVKMVSFPACKRPDGLQALIDESSVTTYPDPVILQQISKVIYDDVLVWPVYATGRAYVQQPYVFDTGHMEYASWIYWRPDTAWKKSQ
jgi:peptide/nickel transport system substrate-binding protein